MYFRGLHFLLFEGDAPHASSALGLKRCTCKRIRYFIVSCPFLDLDRAYSMISRLHPSNFQPCLERAAMVQNMYSICLRRANPSCYALSAQRRQITRTTKNKQQFAPSMEQLRAPFSQQNNSTLYVSVVVRQIWRLNVKVTTH